jgi:tol-pal system protein YbgF
MRVQQHSLAAPVCALLFLGALTGPAHASIFSDDDARKAILELRDSITDLDRQQRERLDAMGKRIDELANRVDAMQHAQLDAADKGDNLKLQIDTLRGATEELRNDVTTAQKREKDRYAELDARLRKLEPADVTVDGHSGQVGRDEQAAYDAAVAQFRASDFKGAIQSLQTFVGRYPQSVYAPAAQFWLGSSYYALKEYSSAVTAQLYLLEHFPDSARAPEALLNIAACQVELNDRKTARSTLNRIIKDYPNSDQAKLAQDRLTALASGGKK